jgi:23S rRNA (uridine2552-2'-O)-methyltransferase
MAGSRSRRPAGKRGPSGRSLHERVKTAKGRKISSTRWLERQLNDPFVQAAKSAGYRSRAAFKLAQIDDRFRILPKRGTVVDLGAAPGGWTQVAVERGAKVIALDIAPIEPIPGAEILEGDFLEEETLQATLAAAEGGVGAVLSDMAAPATGHKATDHLRIVALCEAALDFALEVLEPGGHFVCKVLQGGTEGELLALLKKHFKEVRHVKPEASRQDSAEMYVVAKGFRQKG